MKAHQARDQADQGKSAPEAEAHLPEQNPENISWKIKLSGLTSALFLCFQLPGALARGNGQP